MVRALLDVSFIFSNRAAAPLIQSFRCSSQLIQPLFLSGWLLANGIFPLAHVVAAAASFNSILQHRRALLLLALRVLLRLTC
jgi:hypothetical protein